MNRGILTYLYLFLFLGLSPAAMSQVDTLDTGLEEISPDTVQTDSTVADTIAVVPPEPAFEIIPWRSTFSLGSRYVTGDSLLRWQNWPEWTYMKNREPGVLTFRLGTVGRTNAMLINAHEPRHQELFWEDIPMHDPVSGTVNWNVLPIHKLESVYEDGEGITHRTNFFLKQYYVNKPQSRLIFDESKFERRALEFWLTKNFTQKANVELSYWDRRGGGGYPNSSFTGHQIFTRGYYQMDNRQLLKLRFLNGKRILGEPFGYVIPVLQAFPFNHFSTTPVQATAGSETNHTTLAVSYHRRPPDTTAVRENFRAGLFWNSQQREVNYATFTTRYQVRSLGVVAHKWLDLNPFRLEGSLRYQLYSNKDREESSIDLKNWSLLNAKAAAVFQPLRWWSLKGEVTSGIRDDNRSAYSFGADTEVDLGSFQLSAGASKGIVMPSLQQLYWDSDEYQGFEGLADEKIEEAHGSAEFRFFRVLKAGAKGQVKQIRDGIMIDPGNEFLNIPIYRSLSATGFLELESTSFEISASATLHQYQRGNPPPDAPALIPDFRTERVWFKGGAYWKGYLFDRATYVKAGLSGIFAPKPYLADHYTTPLDYWQPAGANQLIPWFSRLDVDISARVRAIMFVLRYENVLDDVTQLGYFETAGYPMHPRRFLFGVRAVFNN